MARHPGLMRRKARWYLRAKVPVDLVDFLGRDEIWRSLGTGDHSVAVKLYRRARADFDRYCDAQRRRRDAGDQLAGQLPRIVSSWFLTEERRAADADFGVFGDLLPLAQAEAEQDLLELLHGGAEEAVAAAAERILIAEGWPSRPHTVGTIATRKVRVADGKRPAVLYDLARRALVEMTRRRLDRLQGKPNGGYDPLFNGAAVQPVAPDGGRDAADGITLSELITQFSADKAPRLSPGKVTEYDALFRLLREVWGEGKPVRSITRADCRKIRDLVAILPPHATKRWPKLTLVEVAEHAKANAIAPMHPATANAYLQRLSTMLRWALREEHVDRNVAEGLRVAEPEGDPRDARDPFSLDQLRRIFTGLAGEDPWRRWIALLGLFTGCRLNEICGLGTDDAVERDGVPVILIKPDPENGNRLKTASARRVMPVHPELLRLGFLEYVEAMKAGGATRLFPELRRDSRGRHSDLYQKWFSRLLHKVRARAPRTSYHSLRHNFRDALREADVPRDAVLALGGWKAGGTEEIYGSGLRPSTLTREIAKVRYDLDLSHLYTS